MNEILSTLLKGSGGEELVKYIQKEIENMEALENKRLHEILKNPNPPTEELVALKVIVRAKDVVRDFLDGIISMRDYEKGEPEQKDETYGL